MSPGESRFAWRSARPCCDLSRLEHQRRSSGQAITQELDAANPPDAVALGGFGLITVTNTESIDAEDRHHESLTFIAEEIRTREISSLDVTAAGPDRIAALDKECCSDMTVTRDYALARAEQVDRETAKGINRGLLHWARGTRTIGSARPRQDQASRPRLDFSCGLLGLNTGGSVRFPSSHLRAYWHQADLGSCEPLRRVSARRFAGPCRLHDSQRRRCGRGPGRDRGRRPE